MIQLVKVVLVHGIFDTGKSMLPVAGALEAAGHECFCPDLIPNDGAMGLDHLARQLARLVDDVIDGEDRFVLIGFSMGALVSRIYLQEHEGSRRVIGFYSISGPHRGSWTAWFGNGKGAEELKPGSALLKRLNDESERLLEIPIVCYWTPFDLMVFPPRTALWDRAESHVTIFVPAHPLMLRSRRLFRDLVRRIAEKSS